MSAHGWRHFHAAMMGVWAILLVPTLWLWRESLFWIVAMSWYAIVVGHFSAWQASRAEDKED